MHNLLLLDSNIYEKQVNVLSCLSENSGFAVVCDETLFHPQGGGQPADVGSINGVAVTSVKKHNGTITHFLSEALPLGKNFMHVDKQTRYRHSRLHSAGHIIGHILETHYSLKAVKAHHWPNEAKVTFDNPNSITLETETVQNLFDEVVAKNLLRTVSYQDNSRFVSFRKDWTYPCGGTHVENTGELIDIQIGAISSKKGQLIVRYSD